MYPLPVTTTDSGNSSKSKKSLLSIVYSDPSNVVLVGALPVAINIWSDEYN